MIASHTDRTICDRLIRSIPLFNDIDQHLRFSLVLVVCIHLTVIAGIFIQFGQYFAELCVKINGFFLNTLFNCYLNCFFLDNLGKAEMCEINLM